MSAGTPLRVVLLVGAAAAAAFVFRPAAPPVIAQAPPGPVIAGADTQVDVAVTVYNSNIALVRDVREVTLPAGAGVLHLSDIAAAVNPATVHFRSLTSPEALALLEQNYQFDLLEPARLLRKYVGRDVRLVRTRQQNGTSIQEEVTARLLAFNDSPVWQIDGEIVTGFSAEQYRFPEIPETLHSRPTLVMRVDNGGDARHRIETSYLTGRLSWNADYVLTVARDDTSADLDGWVTLTNTSGTAYRNARLQLVAGDLHRVHGQGAMDAVAERALAAPRAEAAMAQEAFSEYHLYSLERRTTLAENETKQVAMLSGDGVTVGKRFVVNGQQFYYRNAQQPGVPLRDPVRVFYRFRNDERSGLGMPMPAGVVRVYQADSRGGIHFAGEDRIGHTPKDEEVALQIGTAFDVICDRRQTEFRRISDRVFEVAFELTLRNHKETPISVEVNEPVAGDWELLTSTHAGRKTDAFALQFNVPVPAGGERTLSYRVRVRY